MDRDRPKEPKDKLDTSASQGDTGTSPGDTGTSPGDTGTSPGDTSGYAEPSVQARTERELALRLITSRAIVDAGFFEQLREDPEAAVAALHLRLSDSDMQRFHDLDWDALEAHVKGLRNELGFEHMLRGAW